MYTPGVAEFSGSDAGCFLISFSTMLMDTSGYSSIEVASSFLKRSCMANLEELELDRCSVIDLAFAGGRHVQFSGADAMICLLCQCGVIWLIPPPFSIDSRDPSLKMQRIQVDLVCKLRLACVSTTCFFLQDVHDVQAEDIDMSLGQQNHQLWFLGEQNPPLQIYLKEDSGVQVYWHSWVTHNERAHACLCPTRVSPLLND